MQWLAKLPTIVICKAINKSYGSETCVRTHPGICEVREDVWEDPGIPLHSYLSIIVVFFSLLILDRTSVSILCLYILAPPPPTSTLPPTHFNCDRPNSFVFCFVGSIMEIKRLRSRVKKRENNPVVFAC
jgi:hypothetical protein